MMVNNLNIEEQYGLWDEYCKCKNNPRFFVSNLKGTLGLTKAEQYKLCDEYSKLDHKDEHEEDFIEDEYECESSNLNDYADSIEDYQEDYEELSADDLSPEGMGYEYFSDDEYLGDHGDWCLGGTTTVNDMWEQQASFDQNL